jgi:hypothetical protein
MWERRVTNQGFRERQLVTEPYLSLLVYSIASTIGLKKPSSWGTLYKHSTLEDVPLVIGVLT